MKLLMQIAEFSNFLKQEYDFSHAVRIRRNCIYSNTIFLFIFFLLEITIDLATSTSTLLLPFFTMNLILSVLVTRRKKTYWIGHIQIALMFGLFVSHILYNPTSFHTMVYWMPFIPILSFFLTSARASYVWLGITIVSILLCGAYGQSTVGPSYPVEPRYVAFAIGGSVFVIGLYFAYAFLFSLVGTYYLDLQEKKEIISTLNEELYELTDKLEQKVLEKVSDIKERNERLEKYAFVNAHIVRAPLANIMGALDLYHETEDPAKKMELLKLLDESANKLDEAVREVASDLNINSN